MSDPITRLTAALEGRYRIERELGEGGMATVYLTDDLKHERKVALKVLKPELAAVVGAERFLVEIKTTANLQHPHILPLFDSGEADSFLFYVMPYVEGETLRDRLGREKQLPVDEAVRIATDVAEALHSAHKHDVIHRDIKPANILLSEGRPLVADFGIALAVSAAGGGRLTETGLSLGTPHYMSPEQATGDLTVGPATDVYAIGCVLYEMLVGEPPFTGSTAQAILGKIIAGEPATATELRASVPANVDAAIRKALEKLPADRFTSAQDFARALEDEHFRHGALAAAGGDGVAAGPWNRLTVTFAALFAVTTAAFAWALLSPGPPDPPRPVTRVSVHIPEDQFFRRGDFDLSADGSLFVYQGGAPGEGQLWAKRWDALDATPIPNTDDAFRPAISPDGQEVAFYPLESRTSIRIVPIEGGVSRTLTDGAAQGGANQRWSPDGAWIYYSDGAGGLSRLPAGGGGEPEILTVVDSAARGTVGHLYVDVLPGNHAVYEVNGPNIDGRIQALDIQTKQIKEVTAGRYPRYSNGYLLFQHATDVTLLVAPFDVDRLELTGTPLPVVDDLLPVGIHPGGGLVAGNFSVSRTGRLVYRIGSLPASNVDPVWVERDGTAREIDPGWRVRADAILFSLALAPDGSRLAMSLPGPGGRADLWVMRFDTRQRSPLTFDGAQNHRLSWSAHSQSLTFVSSRTGDFRLWTQSLDGTGTASPVLDREAQIREGVYSSDGTWLLFREGNTENADIYAVRPGADTTAVALAVTEFISEDEISLSRDDRWLAYVSNRTGRDEVYVSPFPDAGSALVQVSLAGGNMPVWAHNQRELFYRNGANELVAVQFTQDPTFAVVQEDVLFSMDGYLGSNFQRTYDVSPDDQRFVMLRIAGAEDDTQLILVDNFFEELKRRFAN